MQKSKQYIAPGEAGEINGVKVLAVNIPIKFNELTCPCLGCIISQEKICFSRKDKKSLDTRPACFGNDKDNKSRKPLYYVKST